MVRLVPPPSLEVALRLATQEHRKEHSCHRVTTRCGWSVAGKWKRKFTEVPEDAQPYQVQRLLFGLFALERLGLHFATLKACGCPRTFP